MLGGMYASLTRFEASLLELGAGSMNRCNLKSLCGFAMALFVAGCGGSGAVPESLPQSLDPLVAQMKHYGSWMLPEAKNENLFYISDCGSNVYVYSYSLAQLMVNLRD